MHSIPLEPSEKIPFVQKHKEDAICAILREKTPFLAFPEAKKVLLTTQGCARLRTGPIIMQIPRGYHKKKFIVWKGAICTILREKTPFLAFPDAKKGVVNYARLRTGPIIMQIPRGYQKKKFIVWKGAICVTLREKTQFWPS